MKFDKKYTQAEFDAMPRDENGVKHCPSGDYTAVKNFGKRCVFDAHCVFPKYAKFGKRFVFGRNCSFGSCSVFRKGCVFGSYCTFEHVQTFGTGCAFGVRCSFGRNCSFKSNCIFKTFCEFGYSCSFGVRNIFGEKCFFANRCSFPDFCCFGKQCFIGEWCQFGSHCVCEFGEFISMLSVNGFGRDRGMIYFYDLGKSIFVRCGDFCGTLFDWQKKIEQKNPTVASQNSDDDFIAGYTSLIAAVKFQFSAIQKQQKDPFPC